MPSGHLLLVDDDPQMAVLVGILARRAGMPLVCRPDVESAWSAVEHDYPELVLLDMNLPGKRGVELLHRRRLTPNCHIFPVALFCQPIQWLDVAAGWQAGADYLLAKDLVTRPIDWQKRTQEILQHARGQTTIPSLGFLERVCESTSHGWREALNQALAHSSLRTLGPEVINQVLGRALAKGFGQSAFRTGLVPRSGRLDESAPLPAGTESVRRCLASIIEQIWCLLGSVLCERFVAALRANDADR